MTMTFANDTPASFVSGAIKAAIEDIRVRYAQRTQRRAYAELLELDANRLDDLGITAGDIRDALTGPTLAGFRLEASRARRALAAIPQHSSAR